MPASLPAAGLAFVVLGVLDVVVVVEVGDFVPVVEVASGPVEVPHAESVATRAKLASPTPNVGHDVLCRPIRSSRGVSIGAPVKSWHSKDAQSQRTVDRQRAHATGTPMPGRSAVGHGHLLRTVSRRQQAADKASASGQRMSDPNPKPSPTAIAMLIIPGTRKGWLNTALPIWVVPVSSIWTAARRVG